MDEKRALIDKVDCFIFDCDGMLPSCRCLPLLLMSPVRAAACVLACMGKSSMYQLLAAMCCLQLVIVQPFHSCIGVIWRGDSVIDGVPETLDLLRSMVRFGPNPASDTSTRHLHAPF